jgi:DNA-directed RNA polymerase subunit RPC12/RpoP
MIKIGSIADNRCTCGQCGTQYFSYALSPENDRYGLCHLCSARRLLRDRFAASALSALSCIRVEMLVEDYAKMAYQIADAMMAARDK